MTGVQTCALPISFSGFVAVRAFAATFSVDVKGFGIVVINNEGTASRVTGLDELLVSGNELTPVVDQAVKVADGKTLYRRLLSVPVGQCENLLSGFIYCGGIIDVVTAYFCHFFTVQQQLAFQ